VSHSQQSGASVEVDDDFRASDKLEFKQEKNFSQSNSDGLKLRKELEQKDSRNNLSKSDLMLADKIGQGAIKAKK
jgi:hypothetical protein